MRFLSAISANLFLISAALGYGSLLRHLIPRNFSAIDRWAIVFVGGIGELGTLFFCVGYFRFSLAPVIGVLGIGVALFFKDGLTHLFLMKRGFVGGWRPSLPKALVSVALLVAALAGLALPTGDLRMDAIAYHLLGPRVWSTEHIIRPVLDECMTAFPAIVETQFGALMELGGQRAPEFYSVVSLLALLFATLSLGRRLGLSASGAWWAAAFVMTMPVVHRGAYGGFVDVAYSAFVLIAARIAFDAQYGRDFALFGLFCGFAMGTKYFGIPAWMILLISCVFVGVVRVSGRNQAAVLKGLTLASAIAVLVAAPWYVKNWVYLGCPIYPPPPLLPKFFRIRYMTPQAMQNFLNLFAKASAGLSKGPTAFLRLPFLLTFHPANFINGAGGIGLCPLVFAPFGVIERRADRFAQGIALFALLQTMVWLETGQDARYLIHVFVIAAIFAVFGWEYIVRDSTLGTKVLAGTIVALSVFYGLFMIGSARRDDLRSVVSTADEAKREKLEIPFFDSFSYFNAHPEVTRVLVLDARVPTYYLKRPYLKLFGRFGEEPLSKTDRELVFSEPSKFHISHVLDVRPEGGTFRLPENQPGLKLVFNEDDQRIYRVQSNLHEGFSH